MTIENKSSNVRSHRIKAVALISSAALAAVLLVGTVNIINGMAPDAETTPGVSAEKEVTTYEVTPGEEQNVTTNEDGTVTIESDGYELNGHETDQGTIEIDSIESE